MNHTATPNPHETPPSPSRRRAIAARVRAVEHVCAEHVRIVFAVNDFPRSAPGQFVQVVCHDEAAPPHATERQPGSFPQIQSADFRDRSAFLCRPFSIADRFRADDGTDCIALISRNIGPGTAFLDQLQPDDEVQLMGPLGVPYALPANDERPLLAGGGVGIPPLLYLARDLHERGVSDAIIFFGVRNQSLLPIKLLDTPAKDGGATRCLELPGGTPFPAVIASDDSSIGFHGNIVQAMSAWRALHPQDKTPHVYSCGPDAMLRAIAAATREWDIPCQLCIERTMGCGSGTCLSCIVSVADAAGGTRWALSCSEGPVFPRDRLVGY